MTARRVQCTILRPYPHISTKPHLCCYPKHALVEDLRPPEHTTGARLEQATKALSAEAIPENVFKKLNRKRKKENKCYRLLVPKYYRKLIFFQRPQPSSPLFPPNT